MFSRQAVRTLRAAAPASRLVARAPAVRTYAAAAATEAVKPPVAVFGLDGTYATALVRTCSSRYTGYSLDGGLFNWINWLGEEVVD